MRWVDHKKFFGLDRRKARPVIKFGERRQESSAIEAPTLASAVRMLRVRACAANTPAGVINFAERASAVAELAKAQDNRMVAHSLTEIIAHVLAQRDQDWRAYLEAELGFMADRLD